MEGLRGWWARLAGTTRAFAGVGALLVVGLVGGVVWLSYIAGVTESELAELAPSIS